MKEQILELRNQGKTYTEIIEIVKCSKATVSYYCSEGQKEKVKERATKYRKTNLKTILSKKIANFMCKPGYKNHSGPNKRDQFTFTSQDLIDKFGENPKCYLTGLPINLLEPSTYHLDHIIPRSRGGKNELSNVGLATKEANETKHDRTLEELKVLCEMILKNI